MFDLATELAALTETWSPRIVGRVNDQDVKVARLHGHFAWHDRANEDELFPVVSGKLEIRFEDRPSVMLRAGQFAVVPRGVRHNPIAREPVEIVLVEPVTTAHTGDVVVLGLTRSADEQLARDEGGMMTSAH